MEEFKTEILLMTGVFFITDLKQVKTFKNTCEHLRYYRWQLKFIMN